jgi:glucosamine 6-phosphate synthetase-like amidotransferase/phosphosugar isomerase protein
MSDVDNNVIALMVLQEENKQLKEKLEQIERIIKRTEGIFGLGNYTVQQIKEVLENE